jgi:NADH-quinone oxidoreductase subunit G
MRVWFLKETKSLCTKCGRGCNTEIGSRENEIFRQSPRENNDVNSTWMCDQGRLDFHFVNSEYRLTQPLVKASGGHQAASWRQSISTTAEALKAAKPEDIAIIASARMTNEELYLVKCLARALKVEQIDVVPRTGGADSYLRTDDLNPNSNGARIILGVEPGSKLPRIIENVRAGRVRVLLALGENIMKLGLEAADLRNAGFIAHSHILANSTAEQSQVVLPSSSYAEKRGSMINVTGRLQRLNKAIESPGEARDDWEILRDLILAVSGSNGLHSVDDVFKQLAGEIEIFRGLTLRGIGDHGVHVHDTAERVPILEREAERKKQGIIAG